MSNWLSLITDWFWDLFKSVFGSLVDFFHDIFLWLFFNVGDAAASAIVAIPVPAFMAHGLDIGSLYSGFPPFTVYIISKLHLTEAFAILAAGIAFHLLRKLFTLGQW